MALGMYLDPVVARYAAKQNADVAAARERIQKENKELEQFRSDLPTKLAERADPFAAERPRYISQLRDVATAPEDTFYQDALRSQVQRTETNPYRAQFDALLANPGGQETSPFFKYLQETQMNQVRGQNRAGGFANSGRGLMALQDRAAGVASQSFFPLAELLSGSASQYSSEADRRAGLLSGIEGQRAGALDQRIGRLAGLAGANVNPASGANSFLEAYKYLNPTLVAGGGSSRVAQPRQSLAQMQPQQQTVPTPSVSPVSAQTSALPYTSSPYSAYEDELRRYTPSTGSGTGYVRNNQSGDTTFFSPYEQY